MHRSMMKFLLLLVTAFIPSKGALLRRYVEGGNATLPCTTDPPKSDDVTTLVLWYKDGAESPIYGLDARVPADEEDFDEKRHSHFVQPSLGSRAYFDITAPSPALLVSPVKVTDQGVYRCRVDFAHSRTINYYIKLQVIVPPQDVVIKKEDGSVVDNGIGPYSVGDNVALRCEVTGGTPKPVVVWKINGKAVNNYVLEEEEMKKDEAGGSILLIRKDIILRNLSRADLGSSVTCEASNNNISQPVSVRRNISLDLAPTSIELLSSDRAMYDKEPTTVVCRVVGSYPPARVIWYLADRQLMSNDDDDVLITTTVDGINMSTSVLTYTPRIADDEKVLTCRAYNPNIQDWHEERQLKLSVLYSPIVSMVVKSHPNEIWVKENEDVWLQCLNTANPPVTDVRWFYDDRPMTEDHNDKKDRNITMIEDLLILSAVTKDSTGSYRCQAQNEVGISTTEDEYIEVKYTPRCKEGLQLVYGVGVFKTVEVLCQVDALPPHVTFSWNFKNEQQQYLLGGADVKSENMSSVASYEPNSKSDYGQLLCEATNSVGQQKEPCVYTIVHSDAPDPVTNCSTLNQTSNSLYLECEPGYDGGLPQTFIMEVYRQRTHVLQANLTSDDPYFYVEDLPGDTSFMIIVYSANVKGRGHAVVIRASTPSQKGGSYIRSSLATKIEHVSGKKMEMVSITPVLAILIGIVASIVIFVIIVIVITRALTSRKTNASKIKKVHNGSNVDREENDKYDEHNKAEDPLLHLHKHGTDVHIGNLYDANANKQRLNNDLSHRDGHSIKKKLNYPEGTERNEDEVTYAELCFPPTAAPMKINCKESPTEYAKIIVKKKSGEDDGGGGVTSSQDGNNDPCTPLICIHIESTV